VTSRLQPFFLLFFLFYRCPRVCIPLAFQTPTYHAACNRSHVSRLLSECLLDGNDVSSRIVRLISSLTRDNAARCSSSNSTAASLTTSLLDTSSSTTAATSTASAAATPSVSNSGNHTHAPSLPVSSAATRPHAAADNSHSAANFFTPRSSSLINRTSPTSNVFAGAYRLAMPSPPPSLGSASTFKSGASGSRAATSPRRAQTMSPIGADISRRGVDVGSSSSTSGGEGERSISRNAHAQQGPQSHSHTTSASSSAQLSVVNLDHQARAHPAAAPLPSTRVRANMAGWTLGIKH
jgi:hypothetical protein